MAQDQLPVQPERRNAYVCIVGDTVERLKLSAKLRLGLARYVLIALAGFLTILHVTAAAMAKAASDPVSARPIHAATTTVLVSTWTTEFLTTFNILTAVLAFIGSILAIIWYSVTIYESKTCQEWVANRALRKQAKLLLKQQKATAAELVITQNGPSAAQTDAAATLVASQAVVATTKRLWFSNMLVWPRKGTMVEAHETLHDLRKDV